jgi:hypothetical protein
MSTHGGYEPDEPKDVIRRPILTLNRILRILPEDIVSGVRHIVI